MARCTRASVSVVYHAERQLAAGLERWTSADVRLSLFCVEIWDNTRVFATKGNAREAGAEGQVLVKRRGEDDNCAHDLDGDRRVDITLQ